MKKFKSQFLYEQYVAIKTHFNTEEYNYFHYVKKTTATNESYNQRHDIHFFEKLTKHKDPINLMIANFCLNKNLWTKDLVEKEANEIYTKWKKRNQSLSYTFNEDLKKLKTNLRDNIEIKDKEHPFIVRQFIGKKICLETLVVFTETVGCYNYWDKRLKEEIFWNDLSLTIRKYKPFIKFNKNSYKKDILKHFGSINNDRL